MREAVRVVRKFVGPDAVEEQELVRQIREYFQLKREQRDLLGITDNTVQSQQALALRCLEAMSKEN